MKIFTAVVSALFASGLAMAQETVITTEALKAGGVRVTGYVVEAIEPEPELCPDLRYDAFDTNQDGVLDEGCVGITYDACAGESPDYNAWFAAGEVCLVAPVEPTNTDCVPAGSFTTGAPVCEE